MPSGAASGGRPRARDRRAGLRRRSTRCPPADPPAEPTRRPGHVGCDRRDRPLVPASTSPGGAASRVAGSPRGRRGPEAGQAQPLSGRRRSRLPAISGPAQQSTGGRPLRGSARPCRALATLARAHRRRACSSTCERARRGRSSTGRPLHAPPTRASNSWTHRIRSDTSRASRRRRRHATVGRPGEGSCPLAAPRPRTQRWTPLVNAGFPSWWSLRSGPSGARALQRDPDSKSATERPGLRCGVANSKLFTLTTTSGSATSLTRTPTSR